MHAGVVHHVVFVAHNHERLWDIGLLEFLAKAIVPELLAYVFRVQHVLLFRLLDLHGFRGFLYVVGGLQNKLALAFHDPANCQLQCLQLM